MTKEIKSLTGLRGIAAMWIVLHHYFGSAKTGNIVLEAISNIFSNGYLAVDFFFVLSSFVLCYSYEKSFSVTVNRESYKNFMIKRFIRIYPLLIFMLLFSFIVYFTDNIGYISRTISRLLLFFYQRPTGK
jgi:peptidoglycan/LPS O-acetylase OafA/YrhL